MKRSIVYGAAIALATLALVCASRAGETSGVTGEAGRRTVYAWFPRQFGDFDTRAIDWSAITHLSFRSVEIQADGTIRTPQPAEFASCPIR